MTAVLVVAWATRRGKRAACCPPRPQTDVERLRERQVALADVIARRTSSEGRPGAVRG